MSIAILIPAFSLLAAVLIDVFVGDPPNRFHPVAWMGSLIAKAKTIAPKEGTWFPYFYGAAFMSFFCLMLFFVGLIFEQFVSSLPWWGVVLVRSLFASCLFSSRSLASAAQSVRLSLEQGDLLQAKHHLSYHLVSRDVAGLTESQVAAAAIESVSENASDSVIAPFFYYAIAGIPGMLVYRFANTADAMLGYRTQELEWLGKFPARLDDVLNWIPARVTALLILASGRLMPFSSADALLVWKRDCIKTASPNSGHPMSAAAGVLGVELEKVDNYILGRGLARPDAASIKAVNQLLWCVTWLGAASTIAVTTFIQVGWRVYQ